MKKYMKKSEIWTFGIGLFGVALMTGWMPDYTATFFADFAFKGKGFDSDVMANMISLVFLVAGIVGAFCGSASASCRWRLSQCLYSLRRTPTAKQRQSFGCL